jgi:small subunit ribosomal protein S4
MGDPIKPRKKYKTPKNPWRGDQLSHELYLVGTYGLKNKKELWKAQTELSRLRKQARLLLSNISGIKTSQETNFLKSLSRSKIIDLQSTLDDVLSLTIESLLERRLQTITWKKGLAHSLYQARQMITYRHILVKNKVVTVPSYLVSGEEEETVRIRNDSPLFKAQELKPS